MPRIVRAASLREVRKDRGTLVVIDGIELALFRCDDSFFAISNVCAHQHFSVLHTGEFDSCRVECPMHGWTYDVRTGKTVAGEGRVPSYPVTVRGENVFIEMPDE